MRTGFKVLHVNTYDVGGAANSCIRLHTGLIESNVNSNLLLKRKSLNVENTFEYVNPSKRDKLTAKMRRLLFELRLRVDPVKAQEQIDQLQFVASLPPGSEHFSFPTTGIDITKSAHYQEADIIHLHWVADFLDYPSFFKKNKKPVVWTIHDMGPFTGGLHYAEKFLGIDEAGNPLKRTFSREQLDITAKNLDIKKRSLAFVANVNVVSPSKWLMDESKKSELFSKFPHSTIPYGVDTNIFKLKDKYFSREIFGLPRDKKILLFVADSLSNNRKGFHFLSRALKMINNDDLLLCAVGSSAGMDEQNGIKSLGRINDERLLSLAYAAADVFVIPSLEDNLPNTLLESLLCGTPVIGFPIGGIRETISDGLNGYLCKSISVNALNDAIQLFLRNIATFNNHEISKAAVEMFNKEKQAEAYIDLYTKILGNTARSVYPLGN